MKCVKNDLPETIEKLTIEIFSDLHLGSKKCDYKEINNRIASVRENQNTYCVILGDLLNNSTKTSVGDCYSEELSPMQQVKKAIMLFEPIKDKILGVVSGNHERRSYKQDGIDLLYFMCSELGISEKYDYCAETIFVKFGNYTIDKYKSTGYRKSCYSLYIAHGDGQGGRTIGGKANGLQRRGQIVDADIVITGHTHMPFTFRDKSFSINPNKCTVTEHEQVFINASATLDYEEYAELFGMKPSSKVSPKIILTASRDKKIEVRC